MKSHVSLFKENPSIGRYQGTHTLTSFRQRRGSVGCTEPATPGYALCDQRVCPCRHLAKAGCAAHGQEAQIFSAQRNGLAGDLILQTELSRLDRKPKHTSVKKKKNQDYFSNLTCSGPVGYLYRLSHQQWAQSPCRSHSGILLGHLNTAHCHTGSDSQSTHQDLQKEMQVTLLKL